MNEFILRQKDLLAELGGTLLFVVIGTSALTAINISGEATSAAVLLLSALAFSLTLGFLVVLIGRTSGAHVNPAVSLGMAIAGELPWGRLPLYLLSQFVGAILGSIIVA